MPRLCLRSGSDKAITALLPCNGHKASQAIWFNKRKAGDSTAKTFLGRFNCQEQNKPEANFCANPKCEKVPKSDVYTETLGEAK